MAETLTTLADKLYALPKITRGMFIRSDDLSEFKSRSHGDCVKRELSFRIVLFAGDKLADRTHRDPLEAIRQCLKELKLPVPTWAKEKKPETTE